MKLSEIEPLKETADELAAKANRACPQWRQLIKPDEKIVYIGGRHIVVCNGRGRHIILTVDGKRLPNNPCYCKKT